MPKILVIRFSSIGDIVLASPVFRCLKKQLADTELHFVTKRSFAAVTSANPYIDHFFYYEDNMEELIASLKKEKYDYVIDLHRNWRSRKIRKSLKAKSYVIRKLTVEKFLLTEFGINLMPKRHITQRSLDTILPLGVKDDGYGLDYFIPEKDRLKQEDLPMSHSAGYLALVIGANHYTKRLPVDQLKTLCSLIQYPIILLGGKDESAAGQQVAAIDDVRIYNACGKFSLNESADIVRGAKLVVSHDTGLQYIACAFRKPLLAIWGGTSPKLDVEPYYGSLFMQTQQEPVYENVLMDLRCQPCSKYGGASCPLGHFRCMKGLDMGRLAAQINQRLHAKK